MKRLLLALTLLISVSAHAEAIMWCYNSNGGKIVLTDELCSRAKGNIAYIVPETGETVMGCWASDAVAIHVLWSGKYLKSYDYTNWVVVKKEVTM